MEEDDEFGDLYTDVLRPFSSSAPSAPQPHNSSPAPSLIQRPIDLVLQNHRKDIDGDEILHGVSGRNPPVPFDQTPLNSVENSIPTDINSATRPRVLGSSEAKLPNNASNSTDFQSNKQDEEITFDIEEINTGIIEDSGPMIPGLTVDTEDSRKSDADVAGGRVSGEGDEDWEEDSDSEDDLQIVLNDTNHGPMGMERGMMGDGGDDDDDDEDGDPLYVRPGAAPMPGATVGPGGATGQVRPPINMAPLAGRGRGDWRPAGMRNAPQMQKGYHHGFGMPVWGNNVQAGALVVDWNSPFLPTNYVLADEYLAIFYIIFRTIFDVDIDSFEEKPWKYPGVDTSDFFNFGLNEESWKDYCKQLEQHRLETTMQSKIRVYESGRAEQEYDPDLPPELAAAAAGIHEMPADNSNIGKSDVGQSDLMKGPPRVRPPLPTGRAIQVEGGYGERLPSIDTRPPEFVILMQSLRYLGKQIVLQDSLDDDSSTGNGGLDGANNDPPRDDFRGSRTPEDDIAPIETEYCDDFPQAYNNRKGGRRAPYIDSGRSNIPEGDGILPFHPEAPCQYRADSRGPPVLSGGDFGPHHEERYGTVSQCESDKAGQGRTTDISPHVTPSGTRDKRLHDNFEEDSVESLDDKHSPVVSSPTAVRDARELSLEDKDVTVPDEPVVAEGSSGMEKDDMTENESALQELDGGEDSKAARSSENSKARSGSSKDYQKCRMVLRRK
ncbi:hypothetical protein GH714_012687 [Hevea brasiliensis]|uniref:Pre-mRNA polyadenylation factor Fip1 domain-containing protein n=1 Tax=Hevea brasiliensis TaxID=3981 RepID=A0A6A6MDB4_HEVBR|nr:hypothetical protein GH714_012687 [Hevea brasiliensis]